jgi:hypothetical protein
VKELRLVKEDAIWSGCLCPPNSNVETLTPKVIVLGDEAYGRWLHLQELMLLLKSLQRDALSFLPCEVMARRQLSMKNGPHQTLNLQPPEV